MGPGRKARAALGPGRLAALLAIGAAACASAPASETETLAGLTLEYRFAVGRLYRASYGEDTVAFELLEPAAADAPRATLRYHARRVGPGLHFVAWEGPARFRASFVIDLERRLLHASSHREAGRSFFGMATIERVERAGDEGPRASPSRSGPGAADGRRAPCRHSRGG